MKSSRSKVVKKHKEQLFPSNYFVIIFVSCMVLALAFLFVFYVTRTPVQAAYDNSSHPYISYTNISYNNSGWYSYGFNKLCPNGTVYVDYSGISVQTYCDVVTFPNGTKEKINCFSYEDPTYKYECVNGTVEKNVRVN